MAEEVTVGCRGSSAAQDVDEPSFVQPATWVEDS